jgi:toxin CptA
MKSAPTIAFDYRPSRWIAVAAIAVFVVALAAPWLANLPLVVQVGVSLVVAVHGVVALRRFLAAPFGRVACRASGWTLVDGLQIEHAATLRSHMAIGAWIVLDFRLDRRRRFRAVIGPDNLDSDTRRRLILLLSRAEIAHAG